MARLFEVAASAIARYIHGRLSALDLSGCVNLTSKGLAVLAPLFGIGSMWLIFPPGSLPR